MNPRIENKNKILLLICALLLFGENGFTQVQVSKKGVSHGANVRIKEESKVPTYDLVVKKRIKGKVELFRPKNIPKLDIGSEDSLKASKLSKLNTPSEKKFNLKSPIKENSPEKISDSLQQTILNSLVAENKNLKNAVSSDDQTAQRKLDLSLKIESLSKGYNAPQIQSVLDTKSEVKDFTPEELKYLQALIFLQIKKNYPMALALFSELIDKPQVQLGSIFYLGTTARELGLYSEYKYQLLKLISGNDSYWREKSALDLAKNSASGDKALVGILDPFLEKYKLELWDADQYQINRAKFYLEKNKLTEALSSVDEVSMESQLYLDALFLRSLILYKANQIQEAVQIQASVLEKLNEQKVVSEFKSVVALTLARIYFQIGKYKEAFDLFLAVDKKSPEWLQAMTEQAWSQILAGDYEGAAGNMFSLHSDFFKKAFNPESYIVRTVAYLNLCQYGDGARALHDFKKKYSPILEQLKAYSSKFTEDIQYYDTIKTWARNPDLQIVNGLPREFIFALTRHPSFILEQKYINDIEEQVSKLNKITLGLIRTEKNAIKAQSEANLELSQLRKKPNENADRIKDQSDKLLNAKIELYIAKKARNSIKNLRVTSFNRLEKEKQGYLTRAGSAIKIRFKKSLDQLIESLDNSEVLQYEIFSGAGDHLRYQLAGGDVNPKERPELKVNEGKSLNWEFSGELWADEIGHYRSSLKNVCPAEDKSDEIKTESK